MARRMTILKPRVYVLILLSTLVTVLLCMIILTELGTDSYDIDWNDDNEYNVTISTGLKIGILIPATTRGIQNISVYKLALMNVSLPSLLGTLEPMFDFRIYIGIDKGDWLESHIDTLKKASNIVKPIVVNSSNFVTSVNAIAKVAYDDGVDYFVRVNDDTRFLTAHWATKGITSLLAFSPPNIGVVGPTCKQGNTGILTHDMVHRTHWDIFGYYYSPRFTNWYADHWISYVYRYDRKRKLRSWIVEHTMVHGTRYMPDKKEMNRLRQIWGKDRPKITAFIRKLTSDI